MSAPEIGEILLGTMVSVTWHDAWCDNEQTKRQEWDDDMVVETFGTLERDTDRIMTVAGERFPTDHNSFRSVTHIPRGDIEKVKVLR